MTDPAADPVADLRRANAELAASRRAALNALEDAVQARDALRDRDAWLRGQRAALEAALNAAPLAASLGRLVRTATDALGDGTRAAFYLADGAGTALRHVVGMPAAYAELVDGFKVGPESLACGLASHRGEPVITPDVMADPRWEDWRWTAARFGYRGCWSFPVTTAVGTFVGTLAVYWPHPRQAAARELELADLLTHTAGIIISRHQEVEARRQAEAALAAEKEYAESIVQTLHEPLLVLHPDLTVRSVNPAFYTHFRVNPADTVGRKVYELGNRQWDIPALRTLLEDVLPDSNVFNDYEVAHEFEGIGRRVMLVNARRLDHVQLILLGIRDVTGRKRAEEAVRAGEDRLALALTAARTGIWTFDPDTGTLTRDANLNALLGRPAAETARPFAEFLAHLHPDDRAKAEAAFARGARDRRPLGVEFRVVRPDGAVRWLRGQGDVPGDPAGGRSLAGACVDVTERAEAEAAVRASEERLKQIVTSATDYAILTLDDARTVTSWSPGAAVTFGYAADEFVGRSSDELFTAEDRAAGEPAREAETARRDGRAADERWHLRADGSRFWASGVLTRLAAGGFVKVLRDLTDRKRTEDELRAARDELEERVRERTAELSGAIEALEAGMIRRRALAQQLSTAQEAERKRVSRDLHDTVGQTHAALMMALKAAAAAVPARGEAADKLAYAAGLAEAMGKELHQAAVRLRPTALDDIGLGPALAELVAAWSARAGVAAEYQATGLAEAGRLPAGVETALYRVVQEALTNVARHARATAVSVTVARAGGEARAVVEDDGGGFDPAAPTGRLGLAGMRERVELVGGTLEVESAPGRGTTVIARVPVL
jgi:PAS domain S-box-containing protein